MPLRHSGERGRNDDRSKVVTTAIPELNRCPGRPVGSKVRANAQPATIRAHRTALTPNLRLYPWRYGTRAGRGRGEPDAHPVQASLDTAEWLSVPEPGKQFNTVQRVQVPLDGGG